MKLIDLSVTMYDGLRSYKSHPPIVIKEKSTFKNSGHKYTLPCEGFESRILNFSDHSGTHIDAPLHFIRKGESASEMNLEKTFGDAIVLDVSPFKNPFETVTGEMLAQAEQKQGISVVEDDCVLVKTRTEAWGEGSFFDEHAFEKSAGEWLISKKVKLIGLDLPNIDLHDNMQREVHMDVLSENIYIVENLANLASLPLDRRFNFFAMPLKMENATASPVRAIAFI
ncbi:cyclase family protein [Pseudogracilibacillus sp. SO30301A]|uniref:cyclase family protein n=1 Tax=Pseudogracilibacillus sp. SO30301A TaxID=3098291 RepID=UPI00300DC4D4